MANLGKTRGARLPEELDEKFEEYQEEHSMSKTEAVRSLIEAGLEAEHEDDERDRPDGTLGALLYEARELKHTSLLMGVLLVSIPSLATIPFGLVDLIFEAVFVSVGVLYFLTAFFGFVEVGRLWLVNRGVLAGRGSGDPKSTENSEAADG